MIDTATWQNPHGAVGYLENCSDTYGQPPGAKKACSSKRPTVKFYDVVEPVIGAPVPLPEAVQAIVHKS